MGEKERVLNELDTMRTCVDALNQHDEYEQRRIVAYLADRYASPYVIQASSHPDA